MGKALTLEVLALAAVVLASCGPPTPSGAPTPSGSVDPGAVAVAPLDGRFYPATIATDDGRLIVVAGADAYEAVVSSEAHPVRGVVALSRDGGASWERMRLDAGRATGAAIRGSTIWLSVECAEHRCLVGSVDGGTTWRELGRDTPVIEPSLATPSSGSVLGPLVDGNPTTMWSSSDGGASFSESRPCPKGRSPVSISLDAETGVAACRADGDAIVDYDDDWILTELDGRAWTELFDPPAADGPYNPDEPSSLSVSYIDEVVRRAGWATIAGGAGLWRSTDNGHTWTAVGTPPGLPQQVAPATMTIAADGTGFGLVSTLSEWWIVKTTTRGETWTQVGGNHT